ncbi:recombinase, partial [Salmonella enterica]|nr:recombinase [Salmonella enterica]EDD1796564.1 recombinase [Salmonella enterica]EJW8365783.1 recombinase [Salmonella enterica]ELV5095449.1 recombinase [Salmonella enterica]
MDLNKFDAPFSPEDIEWRIQRSGKMHDGKVWALVL